MFMPLDSCDWKMYSSDIKVNYDMASSVTGQDESNLAV